MKQPALFSATLQQWLQSKKTKTLLSLSTLFAEKSFAIIFLLLMALPALPIPTGGITHVTEIITMLLCLELIIGRTSIWLPKRWLAIDVGKRVKGKAATKLISIIEWLEKRSRRRGNKLLEKRAFLSLVGLVVFVFTLAAFVAPPFSGLDTLPALGVVTISLGLILEDIVLVLIGFVIGIGGIGLELSAGASLYAGLKHLF